MVDILKHIYLLPPPADCSWTSHSFIGRIPPQTSVPEEALCVVPCTICTYMLYTLYNILYIYRHMSPSKLSALCTVCIMCTMYTVWTVHCTMYIWYSEFEQCTYLIHVVQYTDICPQGSVLRCTFHNLYDVHCAQCAVNNIHNVMCVGCCLSHYTFYILCTLMCTIHKIYCICTVNY